jgi:hypothetical protein
VQTRKLSDLFFPDSMWQQEQNLHNEKKILTTRKKIAVSGMNRPNIKWSQGKKKTFHTEVICTLGFSLSAQNKLSAVCD